MVSVFYVSRLRTCEDTWRSSLSSCSRSNTDLLATSWTVGRRRGAHNGSHTQKRVTIHTHTHTHTHTHDGRLTDRQAHPKDKGHRHRHNGTCGTQLPYCSRDRGVNFAFSLFSFLDSSIS